VILDKFIFDDSISKIGVAGNKEIISAYFL
jgi:hypothetical protein